MKNTYLLFAFLLGTILLNYSCESEAEKKKRLTKIEKERIELEKKKKEKKLYDKYINNSLYTGSTPYAYCFGKNRECYGNSCPKIKVRTPFNSDVLVTIKQKDKVVRHAYIRAGSSYTFEVPDGKYQPFFYYGKGWNPDKFMVETTCGTLEGGFISDEHFGKDKPQSLKNNILTYELILQRSGNFSTRPSSKNEAF